MGPGTLTEADCIDSAKRFSTLDHLTNGRIGWNIVTSWKKAAFKAIGLDNPIDHDERYLQADEYLRVLYK
jgi:alkanesulfonate monooxygenase SsuD/methylene tetrahydromethanopterin reductase-like flavin-dependent oxidoreductase (luciferase family)